MEYRGRLDHQVKLRGQRIELGEIEAAFSTHPQCRQVAVIARVDDQGGQRLVAYVVPQSDAEPQPVVITDEALAESLLDHARTLLPAAMVPSAVVLMAALPINASGKMDRKALPAPVFAVQARTPARTPQEKQVAAAFADILGLPEQPGVEDDFFMLGGHSLLATRLAARLRDQSGVELTLGAVFEHPEVGRLAAWIERLQRREADATSAGFGPIFRPQTPSALPRDRRQPPPTLPPPHREAPHRSSSASTPRAAWLGATGCWHGGFQATARWSACNPQP